MGLDALAYLGWREAIVAVATLLTIYVIVVFLRINRLRREKSLEPVNAAKQKALDAYAYADAQAPFFSPPYLGPDPVEHSGAPAIEHPAQEQKLPEPLAAPSEVAFPWNEPPEPVIPTVDQPQIEALEREVRELRREIGSLRTELLAWHATAQQQAEVKATPAVAQPISMPPPISPLYSEPMQMAMHGASAGEISMHCGISRAEAELVVALVRNRAEG